MHILRTAVVLLVLLVPAAARGNYDISKAQNLFYDVLYLNPGLVLCGLAPIDPEMQAGFGLGGELSLVYLGPRRPGFFAGLVVDGIYHFSGHRGRVMVGPMIGISHFGIDGGYLVEIADKGKSIFHGGAVRMFATLGVLTLYARYNVLPRAHDSVEFGVMFKIPLPIWGT